MRLAQADEPLRGQGPYGCVGGAQSAQSGLGGQAPFSSANFGQIDLTR